MRIGAKLLSTYFVLIGLVAVVTGLGVPRLVKAAVMDGEKQHLERQAQLLVGRAAQRAKFAPPVDESRAGTPLLHLTDDIFADETVLVLDSHCIVQKASRTGLEKQFVREVCGVAVPGAKLGVRKTKPPLVANLDPVGQIVWGAAPLGAAFPNVAGLNGWQLVVYRDMDFIDTISAPIARGLVIAIVLGFLAAMVIAGWMSREMVRRLNDVGGAAASLAEGDLIRRAPETGKDEITDLARHFKHMAERIQTLVDGLRRSEGSRKELLMMVGHDLRTPMTSIAGFAEALRDGVVQDEVKKARYYAIIAAEAQRLTRLVNDLFDVAKLESGQMELRLQAMPIAPLLVEFVDSMKPVAEAQGARLELEMAPEVLKTRVYVDRDRLEQVVGNLTSNALRFTPKGEAITLRARVEGEELLVEVSDRGPGLTPEEASQVFQRFYQGANQGQGHKGAGLGLAIVKNLVEAHGGQVGVRSLPGQGATFWFKLNRV